jgi:hypothetical protein
VVEQDEQLEQSAKVIRYLQAQLQQPAAAGAGGGGGGAVKEQLLLEQLEAAQDECDELRGQVRRWGLLVHAGACTLEGAKIHVTLGDGIFTTSQ